MSCIRLPLNGKSAELVSDGGGLCALQVEDFERPLRGALWMSFWWSEDQLQNQRARR
jgi:hypothetical protein